MSEVFGGYAHYYDLLYRDKDYAVEADYVIDIIEKIVPNASCILELGCGTGAHAEYFAKKEYVVDGIDLSSPMLINAESRKKNLPAEIARRLSFFEGDVRTCRTGKTYDAVISLFHVMSYLSINADLEAVFETAATHLRHDGLFFFDCWYGPAVLSDKPVIRVKRLSDDVIDVLRIAEPTMHYNENTVDVNYQVQITEKKSGKAQTLHELHKMRYLFMPEIDALASKNGMEVAIAREWMSNKEPGDSTWSICVGLIKKVCSHP
jgi:SAM-dependent methyltransferase